MKKIVPPTSNSSRKEVVMWFFSIEPKETRYAIAKLLAESPEERMANEPANQFLIRVNTKHQLRDILSYLKSTNYEPPCIDTPSPDNTDGSDNKEVVPEVLT
jgi:hypothetical protein